MTAYTIMIKSKKSNQAYTTTTYAPTDNTVTQSHGRSHRYSSRVYQSPCAVVAMTTISSLLLQLLLLCSSSNNNSSIQVAHAFQQPVAFTHPAVLVSPRVRGRKNANAFSNENSASQHKFFPHKFNFQSTREDVDGGISSSPQGNSNNSNNNSSNDPVFEDVDGIGQLTTNVVPSSLEDDVTVTTDSEGGSSTAAVGTVGPTTSIELNVDNLIDDTAADVIGITSIQDIANPVSTSVSSSGNTPTIVEEKEMEIISDNNDVFNIDNILNDATVAAAAAASNNQSPTTSSERTEQNDGSTNSNTSSNSFDNININNPDPDSIVDILNISDNSDTQTQSLIDPAAVVEGIIGGTALKDLDESSTISNDGNSGGDVDIPTSNTDTSSDINEITQNDSKAINKGEEDLLIKSYNDYQGIEEVVKEQVQQIVQNNDLIEDKKVKETVDVPNLAKIIKFAIPAVGVWLCSPLLSLIDTSSVGLLSGTAQQAALNPAVAVTDYSAMLCAFMYTATTNLVAGAKGQEEAQENSDHALTKKTLIQALKVSGYVGLILGSFLISLGPFLLKTIIGNDSIDPQVFAAALRYVRIRALGMPAAVIIGSAQSASIGLQDIKSPMYVLLAAAVVNFLGDVIFVPQSNAWLGGAAGAAWATVFSQYAALAMFFKWMTSKPKRQEPTVNLTKAILELTGKSDEGKSRRRKFRKALQKLGAGGTVSGIDGDESSHAFAATTAAVNVNEEVNGVSKEKASSKKSRKRRLVKKIRAFLYERKNSSAKKDPEMEFTVRGFLSGEKNFLLQAPSLEEAKLFWPYFIPVTTTAVGRVSSYISMSHVVSSTLGTLSMAANQVILSVFYCLTPIADALNLTAQSFVPAIAQKRKSLVRAKALRQLTKNFILGGMLFSVGMVGAVGCLPFVSKYFTSDPVVISMVNAIVPALSGFFATHGIVCSLEGVLLGQKDLNFLGKSYASYFFVVPYFMLRVKSRVLKGVESNGLNSLWNVFLSYNIVRAAMWVIRSRMLTNKAMDEAELIELEKDDV